jgi:hypothetical protein
MIDMSPDPPATDAPDAVPGRSCYLEDLAVGQRYQGGTGTIDLDAIEAFAAALIGSRSIWTRPRPRRASSADWWRRAGTRWR